MSTNINPHSVSNAKKATLCSLANAIRLITVLRKIIMMAVSNVKLAIKRQLLEHVNKPFQTVIYLIRGKSVSNVKKVFQ